MYSTEAGEKNGREIRTRCVWENRVLSCETLHRRAYTNHTPQKTSSSIMLLSYKTVMSGGLVKTTDVSEAVTAPVCTVDSAFLAQSTASHRCTQQPSQP